MEIDIYLNSLSNWAISYQWDENQWRAHLENNPCVVCEERPTKDQAPILTQGKLETIVLRWAVFTATKKTLLRNLETQLKG